MSDSELERRVAAALRAPVGGVDVRARTMSRIRALPAAERPVRRRASGSGRTVRHSIVGVALAAGIGGIGALPSLMDQPPATTAVIGDSVGATLRDTLRLVRLMFDAPGARRVTAVGDFNGWRADSTPLARDGDTGRWSATIALHDGLHRYAFVVDGTRWAVDPSAPRGRADDGRLHTLLHVKAAAN